MEKFLDKIGAKRIWDVLVRMLAQKADKASAVTRVGYNSSTKRLTQTINGSISDVVPASLIVQGGGGITSLKTINGKSLSGSGNISLPIPSGVTDDEESTATEFVATVPGITELRNGVCCFLTNNIITSAANCTLNINGLGAKPIYLVSAAATRATTQFAKNYTWLMIYNETRVDGGCWDLGYLFNTNTTYSNITAAQIQQGTATAGRTVTAAVLAQSYNITGNVINIAGNSIDIGALITRIEALEAALNS